MDLKQTISFIQSIRRLKPHIIHSQMYNANIAVRFLKLLLPKTKIINHYHGMSQWLGKTKLYLDKVTSVLVERFIVVSDESFRLRAKREGFPQEKMRVLYNSVNLPLSQNFGETQYDTPLVIGMASRLIALKNIQAAIFMIHELQKKGMHVLLHIAGEGPEHDPLIAYAKKLDIHTHVKFLGFVSDMEHFYETIDIFCIASTTEDLPLTIIEAMMFGKAVIASRVGGIPDILKELRCSLLIDDFYNSEDILRIQNFIAQINPLTCGNELIPYAQKQFSNTTYCQELEQLYNEVAYS
jgi:glycosyltransferase involved in cell wall biosynthesis